MLMSTFMHLTYLAYLSHTYVKCIRNDRGHVENVEAAIFLLCWRTVHFLKGIIVVRLNQAKVRVVNSKTPQ